MLNLTRRSTRHVVRGAVGSNGHRLHVAPLATAARSWWSDSGEQKLASGATAATLAAAVAAAAAATSGVLASSDQPAWAEGDSEVASNGERSRTPWETVLEKCIPAVVSIKVNATRSFDTSGPGASQATGFVVDAEQGLVLTNRHVVQDGPVLAEALFQNHEEVPLRAVYRDPVHDFGVFQFNPKLLKHLKEPLAELSLRPDKARVGLDIRVTGNNAGEKLSILSGTLARLDRAAPNYGRNSFNDHNTFYFQAASNTSGGSSGSPVLDSDGDVVALNAAGMVGTASSYYLPLDRAKRAVDLIKRGEPVSRGTLQTTFTHTAFNDLQRMGLPWAEEEAARVACPGGVGLLAVTSLVPGGPGDRAGLKTGDVLVSLHGERCANFTVLEDILDSHVGAPLKMEVLRGGVRKSLSVNVQDLHAITPASYLECGDSVFHDLSYHQARNHATPVSDQGVYVCQAGYMLRQAGVAPGSLVQSVNGVPTPNLASFQKALSTLADGALVPIRVRHVTNRHQSALTMLRVDRTWFPAQRVDRLEVSTLKQAQTTTSASGGREGDWEATDLPFTPPSPSPSPSAAVATAPASASNYMSAAASAAGTQNPDGFDFAAAAAAGRAAAMDSAKGSSSSQGSGAAKKNGSSKRTTRFPPGANDAEKAVAQSLVQVTFNMPYMIDGTLGASFVGTGLVVDDGATTGRGLVVVDRNTVPGSLGDCVLHVGSSLEIPGTVQFVHPLHNLSVVAYNAKLLEGVPLKAATLAPPAPRPKATATAATAAAGASAAAEGLQAMERDFLANSSSGNDNDKKRGAARAVYKDAARAQSAAQADCDDDDDDNNNSCSSSSGSSSSGSGNGKTNKASNNKKGLTLVSLLGNQRAGTQLTSKPVKKSRVSQGQPVSYSHPPRFTESNLDAFALEGSSQEADGVVVDGQGRVAAFWGSFSLQVNSGGHLQNVQAFQGLPADLVRDAVEPFKQGQVPTFRTLGADFEYVGLAQVRGMGLDDASVAALEESTVAWPPRLLGVKRRWGGYPAASLLQDGDALLSLDGQPARTFRELELASAQKDEVTLEVLRSGSRQTLRVPTRELGSDETSRVLLWGGAVLQAPPPAVARQRGFESKGVYVASHHRGSPANKFGLSPTSRITEVDGVPTLDLDAFLKAVANKRDGESVRLTHEDLRGASSVSSLKLDLAYWPTYEVERVPAHEKAVDSNRHTWQRRLVAPPPQK